MKPSLSSCIEAAVASLEKTPYCLADGENAFDSVCFGGISYGESRTLHLELLTRKGNVAKKCLQVVISRPALGEPNAGMYELIHYIA